MPRLEGQRNNDFSNVQVGDKIKVDAIIPRTVESVTAKQFVTDDGTRFNKENGRSIGGSEWHRHHAEWSVSFEWDELVQRQRIRGIRIRVDHLSRYCKTDRFSDEAMVAINAIVIGELKRINAEDGEKAMKEAEGGKE